MGQPGGGRNHITPRFSRHYNVVSVTDLEDQTLSSIFKSLLHFFLKTDNFPNEVVGLQKEVQEALENGAQGLVFQVCHADDVVVAGEAWSNVVPPPPWLSH